MNLTKKEAALAALFENWKPEVKVESVPLERAHDRILSEDTYAKYSIPVVRAAIVDSVALRSADFVRGIPDTSTWSRGIQYDFADMGDDFDDRFDCAIQVENALISQDGKITFSENTIVKAGAGIKPKGSTVREEEMLLKKGRKLTPCDLAVLATGGCSHISVFKKPVVAVIPTGSELIARDSVPSRGQTFEANTLMLAAMLDQMGATPVSMPIIRDDTERMLSVINAALMDADIVIVNGGSSKGDEDFGSRLLREQGKFLFHEVAAVPGRPLAVTIVDNKPVINLPGPPPAAFNAAEWFLKSAIAYYLKQPVVSRRTVKAVLTETLDTPLHMAFTARLYLIKSDDGSYLAVPIQMGRDSLAKTMAADAIFISPIGSGRFDKGTEIAVELLRNIEDI